MNSADDGVETHAQLQGAVDKAQGVGRIDEDLSREVATILKRRLDVVRHHGKGDHLCIRNRPRDGLERAWTRSRLGVPHPVNHIMTFGGPAFANRAADIAGTYNCDAHRHLTSRFSEPVHNEQNLMRSPQFRLRRGRDPIRWRRAPPLVACIRNRGNRRTLCGAIMEG